MSDTATPRKPEVGQRVRFTYSGNYVTGFVRNHRIGNKAMVYVPAIPTTVTADYEHLDFDDLPRTFIATLWLPPVTARDRLLTQVVNFSDGRSVTLESTGDAWLASMQPLPLASDTLRLFSMPSLYSDATFEFGIDTYILRVCCGDCEGMQLLE